MAPTLTTDVVTLLKQDHEAVKKAFEQFDSVPRDRWGTLFFDLSQLLIAHEVAEEMVVYPAIRKLDGGAEMVAPRLEEQAMAERTLVSLERLDPRSDDFATEFASLRENVLAHAKAEEQGAFVLLASATSEEDLGALGKRYQDAKAAAPTHPHPHTPNSGIGNAVVGPVVALFDRVRDKMIAAAGPAREMGDPQRHTD